MGTRGPKVRNILERFEEKLATDTNTGCLNYTGGTKHKHKHGYGGFWMNGKMEMSHRAAYTLFVGEIPKGLSVLHKCDNTKCCNPSHLFLGTQVDNMKDMWAKGRGVTPTYDARSVA